MVAFYFVASVLHRAYKTEQTSAVWNSDFVQRSYRGTKTIHYEKHNIENIKGT